MSATAVDRDPAHLFPAFRDLLALALAETEKATGRKWVIAEGYRSQERQTWLYAQGRTRPGKIVTWMKTPMNHGAGCAADCYPADAHGNPDYNAPRSVFMEFRKVYLRWQALGNPAWEKGDLGHVQLVATPEVHAAAVAWVARGFK